MHAQWMDFLQVFFLGTMTMSPFWLWTSSLSKTNELEACDRMTGCMYSSFFSSGGMPNSGLFTYFVIHNGESNTTWSDWLSRNHVSPLCSAETADAMADKCQLVRTSIVNPMQARWSTAAYQVALALWGGSRIVHDWMLLAEYKFEVTIRMSNWSTLFLVITTLSATMVSWNALELFYAPLNPSDSSCGCYFRYGFLTAAGAVSMPFALMGHCFAKIQDTMRALVGGDCLITKKFHLAYHLMVSARLKPTGSALGPLGFGVSECWSPDDMLIDDQRSALYAVSSLGWKPLDILYQQALLGSFPFMVGLCACALPLFVMRGEQLIFGSANVFITLIAVGLVSMVFLCTCLPVRNFTFNPANNAFNMFLTIFTPEDYDTDKKNRVIDISFKRSPEIAEIKRLDFFAGRDPYLRSIFAQGIAAVKAQPLSSQSQHV